MHRACVACVVACPTRMLRSVGIILDCCFVLWSRSERAFEFGIFSRGMNEWLGSVGVNVGTIYLPCLLVSF